MSQHKFKKVFIIASPNEPEDRKKNVAALLELIPEATIQPAIYPSITKVPFLERLKDLSAARTGTRLNNGEIGILLTNRSIWRSILQMEGNSTDKFLILESDSTINNLPFFLDKGKEITDGYDMFFLGAWSGNMKLKRSTIQTVSLPFKIGVPYMKSVCCGYGYVVNTHAASQLLQFTKKIGHPVDEFKKYLPKNIFRIGGIMPELISELPYSTTIGHPNYGNPLFRAKMFLVHLRNSLVSYFS
ncbi:MAG: glycosyltransferase family 25 protein [Hydrotalea sp.]|nr:glycosyltransferase family 25 protein [Hydrotalea sp.]